ncbi:hypothetical protein DOY81_002250, partial [Sarcophaga bullata]
RSITKCRREYTIFFKFQ